MGVLRTAPRMLAGQAEISLSKKRNEHRQSCSRGGRAGQSHRINVHREADDTQAQAGIIASSAPLGKTA